MVELPVGAGALADDVERVAEFGFALQGLGVGGEFVHQYGHFVGDVDAAALAGVAEEAEHAVALGEPAVFGDYLRRWIRRQLAFPLLPLQPADEAGVEGGDADGIVDARADIADAQFHRG